MRPHQAITTSATGSTSARRATTRAARGRATGAHHGEYVPDSLRLLATGRFTEASRSLDRASQALAEARLEPRDHLRYAAAHVAALRATAAVLVVRARPQGRRPQRQGSAWVLLERVAPELAEWAALFAAGASRRAAAEAGRARVVSARDADDLVRDVEAFLRVVERLVARAA